MRIEPRDHRTVIEKLLPAPRAMSTHTACGVSIRRSVPAKPY